MRKKNILNFNFMPSLMIPIAIVLAGALIIYGITSLLTSEKTYRDLVKELNTKTFGNRWVAAFELSKYLNHHKIPPEELPWFIENLSTVYDQSVDARTRNFVVMALGSLKTPLVQPVMSKALRDANNEVKFHALVSLGNMPVIDFDWNQVLPLLQSDDPGLRQVAALTLATHRVDSAKLPLRKLLVDNELSVRYAAATALIYFKDEEALPLLREILEKDQIDQFNAKLLEVLKFNILSAIQKEQWVILRSELEKMVNEEKNLGLSTKAKEVLKSLNN